MIFPKIFIFFLIVCLSESKNKHHRGEEERNHHGHGNNFHGEINHEHQVKSDRLQENNDQTPEFFLNGFPGNPRKHGGSKRAEQFEYNNEVHDSTGNKHNHGHPRETEYQYHEQRTLENLEFSHLQNESTDRREYQYEIVQEHNNNSNDELRENFMRENISDLVETLEPRASFKKNNNGKKGSKRKPTQPGVEIFQNLKDSNTEQSAKMIANPLGEDLCGLDIPRRIIGGTTTDIDEFPWLCLLQYLNSANQPTRSCGGVLISKRYVLTAAHCTSGAAVVNRKLKLDKIILGEWDLSADEDCQGEVCSAPVQQIDIEEIIPHEGYGATERNQAHDIALIRLKTPATFNQFVQPICLPFNDIGKGNYEGRKLTVSGWGRTSNARDSSSNVKKKVDLPVVSWSTCSDFYNSFYNGLQITGSQFCAGGVSGEDTCQGDSGGPLMTIEMNNNELHWYVIGIVSSGPAACAVEGRPSLYTNVTQYMDWILQNVRND